VLVEISGLMFLPVVSRLKQNRLKKVVPIYILQHFFLQCREN